MIEEGQKKKNKTPIILMILGFLIIVLSGGFLLIANKNLKKEAPTPTPEPTLEPTPESTPKEEIKRNGKKLTVYYGKAKSMYATSFISETARTSDDAYEVSSHQITCFTDECKVYSTPNPSYGEKFRQEEYYGEFVLLQDGDYVDIVNVTTDELLDYLENIKGAKLYGNASKKIIFTLADDKVGIYDINQKKLAVPFQDIKILEEAYYYYGVRGIGYDEIFKTGYLATKNGKYGVIDHTTGKSIIDFNYDTILCYRDYDSSGPSTDYCKAKKSGEYEIISYNENTKKIQKIETKVKEFYGRTTKYAYINKDNALQLINLENFEPLYTFSDFNSNGELHYMNNANIQFKIPNDDFSCIEYYYKEDTKEAGSRKVDCAPI